jgi:hypothetical protein
MKRDAMKYPFTENYPTLTQKEKLTLAVVADLCLCSHLMASHPRQKQISNTPGVSLLPLSEKCLLRVSGTTYTLTKAASTGCLCSFCTSSSIFRK